MTEFIWFVTPLVIASVVTSLQINFLNFFKIVILGVFLAFSGMLFAPELMCVDKCSKNINTVFISFALNSVIFLAFVLAYYLMNQRSK